LFTKREEEGSEGKDDRVVGNKFSKEFNFVDKSDSGFTKEERCEFNSASEEWFSEEGNNPGVVVKEDLVF